MNVAQARRGKRKKQEIDRQADRAEDQHPGTAGSRKREKPRGIPGKLCRREIEEQTGEALDGVVDAFRINWVWMPPWGPEKITEDGREMMRAIGFSI